MRLTILKQAKKKKKWRKVFLICKSGYVLKIQYTIHWDKTIILKKFPSDKINVVF